MSISGTRPTLFIEPAEKVFESKNILHIAYDKTNINGKKDESFECMSEINGAKKIDLSDELNLTNHEFNNESNDSKLGFIELQLLLQVNILTLSFYYCRN